jgi:hypothetical protein
MKAGQARKTTLLNWRLRLQTSGIYRDPAIPDDKNKTGGPAAVAAPRPGLAPESALRLHPCRALPSAPVRISV